MSREQARTIEAQQRTITKLQKENSELRELIEEFELTTLALFQRTLPFSTNEHLPQCLRSLPEGEVA